MAETFGITQKNSEVFFYDQYNTPIRTVNVLEWAFQKYESDASFLIKIEFRPKQTDEIETLITSEVFIHSINFTFITYSFAKLKCFLDIGKISG